MGPFSDVATSRSAARGERTNVSSSAPLGDDASGPSAHTRRPDAGRTTSMRPSVRATATTSPTTSWRARRAGAGVEPIRPPAPACPIERDEPPGQRPVEGRERRDDQRAGVNGCEDDAALPCRDVARPANRARRGIDRVQAPHRRAGDDEVGVGSAEKDAGVVAVRSVESPHPPPRCRDRRRRCLHRRRGHGRTQGAPACPSGRLRRRRYRSAT